MKSFLFTLSFLLISASAYSQMISFSDSISSGLSEKDSYWDVGKGPWALYSNWDQSALAAELGCFPSGAQTPLDETRVDGANQNYGYSHSFSGVMKPGQSFTIKIRVCDGGGKMPVVQSSVYYEKLNRKIALSGYWIDPLGRKADMYHPLTTLPDKTMWGGTSVGLPGVWTFVVMNKTRYPLNVFGAGFIVVLHNSK